MDDNLFSGVKIIRQTVKAHMLIFAAVMHSDSLLDKQSTMHSMYVQYNCTLQ